ncbi:MAG: DUF1385 domain-containing protein [Clostridia bacterium]
MKIFRGSSDKTSISFTSGNISARAMQEGGKIKTKIILDTELKRNKKVGKVIIFAVISAIVNILVGYLNVKTTYQIIPLILPLSIYTLQTAHIYTLKQLRQNHAAEHMVIAAYNRYGYIPCKEEILKEKQMSKYCGQNNVFGIYIMLKIISTVTCIKFGIIIPETIILAFSFLPIMLNIFPLNIFNIISQKASLLKPSKQSIDLALEALIVLVDYVELIEKISVDKLLADEYIINKEQGIF